MNQFKMCEILEKILKKLNSWWNNKDLLEKIFLVFLILVFLFVGFRSVSAYESNWTTEQKEDLCNYVNFSFVECFEFWEMLEESVDQNETIIYINCTNTTITETINETIYIQNATCPECVCENCSEDDLDILEKIDAYEYRGFEPVFENGLIVNWRIKENITCEDNKIEPNCEEFMSEEVAKIKRQYSSNEDSFDNSDDPSSWFPVVLVLVIGGVASILIFKFVKKPVDYSQIPPLSPYPQTSEGYNPPAPPIRKPMEKKVEEEKQEKKENPNDDGF